MPQPSETTGIVIRARALILVDNYILFARAKRLDTLFFPGGKLRAGETLLTCLRRELLEEIQATANAYTYLGAIEAKWNEPRFAPDGSEWTEPVHDLSHFFAAHGPFRFATNQTFDFGPPISATMSATGEDRPVLPWQGRPEADPGIELAWVATNRWENLNLQPPSLRGLIRDYLERGSTAWWAEEFEWQRPVLTDHNTEPAPNT